MEHDETIGDLPSYWPKIVDYTGLSEYEAKVYLSLLIQGTSGARKLSLHCEVPRTKVYGTLRKLIDEDLVVEIPGTPKKFSPVDPEEAFKALLRTLKRRAIDFDLVLRTLGQTHEGSMFEARPKKTISWYLEGEEETKEKSIEMIRRCRRSLTILTNEEGLGIIFNSAHRLLDEIHQRGISATLYSPLDPITNPLARELSYIVNVNKLDFHSQALFINSDYKEFLLARVLAQGDKFRLEDAIFSCDRDLIEILTQTLFGTEEEPRHVDYLREISPDT